MAHREGAWEGVGMERTIIHVDMDAYFASIEQRDAPIYRGKPLVVCHSDDLSSYRGVVAASSYEAREFGVKSGMSVLEAKLRLPNAAYISGNYDKYLYNTRRLINICEGYSDALEVYSIDEAFLDITQTARFFGSARDIAMRLQNDIHHKLRLSCSVGVAPNKLMAKMASELRKPGGLTVIRPDDLPELLAPMPVDSIPGVGRCMRKHLNATGVITIGHLADLPVKLLRTKFGIIGEILHRAAHGIDDSPVVPTYKGMEVKSFGQSMSLGSGSTEVEYLCDVLLGLCDGATRRMRKDGYVGKTVTLYMCFGRLFGASRRISLGEHTNLPGRVYSAARNLLIELFKEHTLLEMYPVTKVGMSATNLIREDAGWQESIFDVLNGRESNLVATIDALKNKYGDKAVTRCALLGLRGKYRGVARSEIGIF
ncbi:MAG TPA: DNA polymerase IV [Candidatus Aquicultor sp.]|jgi:DNA polymerase-4